MHLLGRWWRKKVCTRHQLHNVATTPLVDSIMSVDTFDQHMWVGRYKWSGWGGEELACTNTSSCENKAIRPFNVLIFVGTIRWIWGCRLQSDLTAPPSYLVYSVVRKKPRRSYAVAFFPCELNRFILEETEETIRMQIQRINLNGFGIWHKDLHLFKYRVEKLWMDLKVSIA